jgi:hypothetical protein
MLKRVYIGSVCISSAVVGRGGKRIARQQSN